MNPLYINEKVCSLSVEDFHLKIWNPEEKKVVHLFKPRKIPYDSIIIQRNRGSISFAAIDWLMRHAISLTILNWQGNIMSQILPEETLSPKLRIAQYQAYLDWEIHSKISKSIVETKIKRQRDFLKALSPYFDIEVPSVRAITTNSPDFIRNMEARYAEEYFTQYGIICNTLGYEFENRSRHSNQHANDLTNSLLNYGYAILKVYVRRAINAVGFDNSVSYVHFLSKGESSLTFDLMELWRTNIDQAVLESLEEMKKTKGRKFGFTDKYDVEITSDTARLLFERIRFNLSLEEIIINSRRLAKYLLKENTSLAFKLRPLEPRRKDTIQAKGLIKSKSYRELGMNKSTLWYQKKRLEETGSIRIYNKTRQYFVR